MTKLLKYLKPYSLLIIIVFISVFIQTVFCDLALPDYMSNIVNNGIVAGDTDYIIRTGIHMLLVALLGAVCTIITGFCAARVGSGFARDIRKDTFANVENYSESEIKKFGIASLITRSTNDIQQVQMFITIMLRMVLSAPIMGIGGVMKAMGKSSSMSWIIAVGVAALLLLIGILVSLVLPKFSKMQKLVDELNLVTRENLTGMMVVRAFGTEKEEEKRFEKTNHDVIKTDLFVNRVMNLMNPMMNIIISGVMIMIVWFGSHAIDMGTMQVGDMMAFIQYTMQIMMSFLMISMIFVFLPRAQVSAKRVAEILETKNSILDKEQTKNLKDIKGEIEFKNVSFRYPDAYDDILTGISFKAKPGEITAFIGSTGSGKSTLINLIPRFYDVSGGQILIDGKDIREVSQQELRDHIGYVPQKGILFSGTIESNIKFGNNRITEEAVNEALSIAQATDFVMEKEDGIKSHIAQGGDNVSGGQKQRLSIARAIAKNPKIYIFDDSFSALDYKTDAKLRKALQKKVKNATVFIVAQRISSIMHADQIVVLEEGHIDAIGTHKELLETSKIYKEIALSQLGKEEL